MLEVFLAEKARTEIEISEAEIRQEYDNHPEKYCTEPVVGIITIEFLTLEDAREVIRRCQEDGECFAELKREYEAQMVTKKEIVRYFAPSVLPYAPYSQVAFKMDVDEISAPIYIPRQKKYLLIKKVGHVVSRQLLFQEADSVISRSLFEEKIELYRRKSTKKLRSIYSVRASERLVEKDVSIL